MANSARVMMSFTVECAFGAAAAEINRFCRNSPIRPRNQDEFWAVYPIFSIVISELSPLRGVSDGGIPVVMLASTETIKPSGVTSPIRGFRCIYIYQFLLAHFARGHGANLSTFPVFITFGFQHRDTIRLHLVSRQQSQHVSHDTHPQSEYQPSPSRMLQGRLLRMP